LKQLCEASGWPHDEVVDAVDDILEQHENEQLQALAAQAGVAGKGAGALDDDDTDDPDEKLRRLLSSKGLDDADVERAIEWAHRDRKEAADRIPKNGLHGTGGHTSRGPSGSSRDNEADFEREFPDAAYTTRDVYGAPASEQSDPVRRLGERAAERLPGGGTSRRLAAGDMAFDEEQQIEREYGRGPGIGMFGG
jgi:hypothetical protein